MEIYIVINLRVCTLNIHINNKKKIKDINIQRTFSLDIALKIALSLYVRKKHSIPSLS
jgi:hypothetical protein